MFELFVYAIFVPIVFAFNKMDRDGVTSDKLKEELSQMNILVEEWGGKFQHQDISAKTGLGIDDLLEKSLIFIQTVSLQQWWDTVIQNKGYTNFLSYLPKILLAFVIPVLDSIYNNIAIWLNDMGK